MDSPVSLPPGAVLDKAALPPGAVLDAPSTEKSGILSDIGDTLKQYWDKVNPIKAVQGAAQMAAHPIDTVAGYGATNSKLYDSAKQSFKNGDYSQGVRHTLSYFLQAIPGLGSALDEAGNKAEKGDVKGAIADTAALATQIAAPKVVGAAADVAAPAVGAVVDRVGTGAARGLMKSALKPGVADAPTLADVRSGVDTALQNQIPVTEAGAGKLSSLIADYGRKTQAVIDAKTQQGGTVEPAAVASRLNQINTSQVLPEKDIATINKAKQAFMERNGALPAQPPTPTGILDANGQPIMRPGAPANPGNPIPLDVAQAEKQGTYQQNAAKYGELSQAQIEAEKALARGYREELEAQAPELKLLNQKESEFLGLQPMLERAVRRAGNADVVDFKTLAETGAGAAAAGPLGAAAGLTTRILDFPGLKSRLAIAISKASNKTGSPLGLSAANARAAAIIGSLGSAGANNQPEATQ